MYIERKIDIYSLVQKKSCFLFGARQTGKTSLINHSFADSRIYNLLDSQEYMRLSLNPKLLEQQLQKSDKIIVIDEIQRLPALLNEVHLIIEKYKVNFLLTGSSARKLRRGGVNLLGGRARVRYLHPFIYKELNKKFDLFRALNFGLLPPVYLSDEPDEEIKSYAGVYLKEEIASEGFVRNVPAFGRFLTVAALCSGNLLNYAKISSDSQVPASTVREYFQILRDTLIGFDLKAWKKSAIRKPISTSKFYFFDTGVLRYLQDRGPVTEKTPEAGYFFENYMAHELKTYLDYNKGSLCYWRSKSGYEVDFIINDTTAVEVKAKDVINSRDLKGLRALKEEGKLRDYIVVSFEKRPRTEEGIKILPWRMFLDKLWEGDLVLS